MAKGNEFARKLRDLLADPALSRVDLAEAFARQYTSEAIEKLVNVMRDPEAPQSLQVKCALELIARGWGKPAIAVRVSGDNKDKEEALRIIDSELEEAERVSRQIMELAKMGGLAPELWFPSDNKLIETEVKDNNETISE